METTILLDMLGSTSKVQVRRMGLLEALVMVSEPDRHQSRFEAQFMTSLLLVLVVCQVLDVSTSLRVFGRNCKAFIAGRSLEIFNVRPSLCRSACRICVSRKPFASAPAWELYAQNRRRLFSALSPLARPLAQQTTSLG